MLSCILNDSYVRSRSCLHYAHEIIKHAYTHFFVKFSL